MRAKAKASICRRALSLVQCFRPSRAISYATRHSPRALARLPSVVYSCSVSREVSRLLQAVSNSELRFGCGCAGARLTPSAMAAFTASLAKLPNSGCFSPSGRSS